jgi:hypothetical protein
MPRNSFPANSHSGIYQMACWRRLYRVMMVPYGNLNRPATFAIPNALMQWARSGSLMWSTFGLACCAVEIMQAAMPSASAPLPEARRIGYVNSGAAEGASKARLFVAVRFKSRSWLWATAPPAQVYGRDCSFKPGR